MRKSSGRGKRKPPPYVQQHMSIDKEGNFIMATKTQYTRSASAQRNTRQGPALWETHQVIANKKDMAYEYDVTDELVKEGDTPAFRIDGLIYKEEGLYGPYWEMYISREKDAPTKRNPDATVTELCKVYMNSNVSTDDTFHDLKDAGQFPTSKLFRIELIHFVPKGVKRAMEKTFYRIAEVVPVGSDDLDPTHGPGPDDDVDELGELDEHPFNL